MRAAFADELDLAEPDGVWHTDRTIVTELAGALGTAAAAIGKVATDVVLLAQSEVGELRERAPGGSSAMAHKQNPIAAVTARAAAAQAPGLVATLLAAGSPELQRGAGSWHAEWPALIVAAALHRRRRIAAVDRARPRRRHRCDGAQPGPPRGHGRHRRCRSRRRLRRPLPGAEAAMSLAGRSDGPEDAPPLVLLNSVGSTTEMWAPVVGPLAEQFRVIRIDHRGHGDSAPSPAGAPSTIADLGRRRARRARRARPRPGPPGRPLARRHGRHVAGDPPPGAHRPARAAVHVGASDPAAALGRPRPDGPRRGHGGVADAVVARWLTPALAERDAELVAGLRAMVASIDAESYAQCCEAIATMDLRADLGRIAAPTLVIAGAQDTATPLEQLEVIASGIAGGAPRGARRRATSRPSSEPGDVAALLLQHFRGGATLAAGFATRRAVLGDEHVDRAIASTTPTDRAVPGVHHSLRVGRRLDASRACAAASGRSPRLLHWSRSAPNTSSRCMCAQHGATALSEVEIVEVLDAHGFVRRCCRARIVRSRLRAMSSQSE